MRRMATCWVLGGIPSAISGGVTKRGNWVLRGPVRSVLRMHRRRAEWKTRQRRDMAWILVLLAGVQVGLLAAVIGVLVEDFVVGTVVALVPGAVVVGIWWRRFLD